MYAFKRYNTASNVDTLGINFYLKIPYEKQ